MTGNKNVAINQEIKTVNNANNKLRFKATNDRNMKNKIEIKLKQQQCSGNSNMQ